MTSSLMSAKLVLGDLTFIELPVVSVSINLQGLVIETLTQHFLSKHCINSLTQSLNLDICIYNRFEKLAKFIWIELKPRRSKEEEECHFSRGNIKAMK